MSEYYCYILRNDINGRTYNGSTNSLPRRIRQHNGEIVGGAKATHTNRPWKYCMLLKGFDTHREALSCEWRIKHPTKARRRPPQFYGAEGRILSMNHVLNLDQWTSKSSGLGRGEPYTIYVGEEYVHLLEPHKMKQNVHINVLGEHELFKIAEQNQNQNQEQEQEQEQEPDIMAYIESDQHQST